MNYESNKYRATCVRVVDGDTLELTVDLGLRCERNLYVRLTGIDAPELRGKTADKKAAVASAAYLESLVKRKLPNGGQESRPLIVQFQKGKSFDRWLGKVYQADGDRLDVQAALVAAGHAVKAK